jgi:hypothetical protein
MNSEPVSIKTLMVPLKTTTAINALRHAFNSTTSDERGGSISYPSPLFPPAQRRVTS